MIYELQRRAREADLTISLSAFEDLSALFHKVLAWLHSTAVLPTGSLGVLLKQLPENDAWERYRRGEHAAAWAGVELARLYKRIKAQTASRSKRSIIPLRDLLYGFKVAGSDWPPNEWFRLEYQSKRYYRPTGRMAVWVARKIEEIRRLKELRSTVEWGSQLYASIRFVVQSERAFEELDRLPPFGDPGAGSVNAWRSFVRHELLTQKEIMTQFEELFPKQRKKLDGVITSTLCLAWQAVQGGRYVILP